MGIDPQSTLSQILCGQFGDYGIVPSKASFFIHAGVVTHYIKGGCYPIGGPNSIVKNLIYSIEKKGGKVLTGANVNKILYHNNKVIGLSVNNNNNILYCDNIISSIGVPNTYKLLNKTKQKSFPKPSCKFMFLFVGIEGYKGVMPDYNMWIYPHGDFDKIEKEEQNSKDGLCKELERGYFISSGSSKSNNNKTNKHTITIICNAQSHWYDEWRDLNYKARSKCSSYIKWKEEFGNIMLKNLLKYIPDIESYITYTNVGTPLSTKHFIGSKYGEVYGLTPEVDRWDNKYLYPKTEYEGLYLTGQDIVTAGFAGAVSSAELTSNVVVGYGSVYDIINNRDLISDLQKL